MKKMLIGIIAILILVTVGGIYWYWGGKFEKKTEVKSEETSKAALAPAVENVLNKKINFLSELIKDPVIVDAVKKSNEKNAKLSPDEISQLDKKWMNTEGVDDWIKPYMTNEPALKLAEFQEKNTGFSEIFISDSHGLIVSETNKTSDYYQADESWWVKGYADGKGKAYYGEIEFDESSQTESIPIYVPVTDRETNTTIGVVKATIDIIAIKIEL